MNQYSRPSASPGRRAREVAETVVSSSGTRASTSRMSVPFPAPDWPVMTKTGAGLAVEETNQLGPLPVGQAADRLRLADSTRVQEARRFHPPELRHGHQDVDHLRGRDVVRRVLKDLLDLHPAVLQVFLQLRPLDADVVRALEGIHPLVQRTDRKSVV